MSNTELIEDSQKLCGELAARTAWDIANTVTDELDAEWNHCAQVVIEQAESLCSSGRVMRAGVVLSCAVDDAVQAGNIGLAIRIIQRVNPSRITGSGLVGVLSNSLPFKDVLGEARTKLASMALDVLAKEREWSIDEARMAREQLS